MSQSPIGNTKLISTLNNRLVLEAVRVLQPTFRAEVARKTRLKPATVTSIVNDLLAEGLLQEVEGQPNPEQRFGRPPLLLQMNADARRILAVDLEPDHIRVAITDLLANVIQYHEEPADRFADPRSTIDQIARMANAAVKSIGDRPVLGAGVSLPGLIDSANGILLSSTNMPKWRNVPIGSRLEAALGIPTRVERSMHLAALYEKWRNPQHQQRTVVIISLRTGVGMSLLHRGQLYDANSGLSGEIGHTVIDIAGKPCDCGSRGCLETFVSSPAIVLRGHEMIGAGRGATISAQLNQGATLTPELIYRLAKDGDKDSAEIVRDVGHYLGIAISNIINLLVPDEVVIAGAIDLAEQLLLQAIREQVATSALPRSREHVVIRAAQEKEKLPLLGAAVLIAQDMFDLPDLRHADLSNMEPSAAKV